MSCNTDTQNSECLLTFTNIVLSTSYLTDWMCLLAPPCQHHGDVEALGRLDGGGAPRRRRALAAGVLLVVTRGALVVK